MSFNRLQGLFCLPPFYCNLNCLFVLREYRPEYERLRRDAVSLISYVALQMGEGPVGTICNHDLLICVFSHYQEEEKRKEQQEQLNRLHRDMGSVALDPTQSTGNKRWWEEIFIGFM